MTKLPPSPSETTTGYAAAVIAFMTWGLYPLFFKQLGSVASAEILAHRILWSCAILLTVFVLIPAARRNLSALRNPRNLVIRLISAALISINWFCFIHAVNTDRILEASLGYFLIPVVNALLGAIFLGETLHGAKKLAVFVAFTGIASIFFISGTVPVIALAIAISFGSYGLVRKVSPLDSSSGLFLETILLSPIALVYLQLCGVPLVQYPPEVIVFLVLAGVMTLIPLLCMVVAARLLEYTTLGFLQYLTPATQFTIAVAIYKEPISPEQTIAFGTVTVAVILYVYGSLPTRQFPSRQ